MDRYVVYTEADESRPAPVFNHVVWWTGKPVHALAAVAELALGLAGTPQSLIVGRYRRSSDLWCGGEPTSEWRVVLERSVLRGVRSGSERTVRWQLMTCAGLGSLIEVLKAQWTDGPDTLLLIAASQGRTNDLEETLGPDWEGDPTKSGELARCTAGVLSPCGDGDGVRIYTRLKGFERTIVDVLRVRTGWRVVADSGDKIRRRDPWELREDG